MKKNIKLFSMTLCCLAVMALSSCLSSNDDDNKNQEKEWQEWVKAFQAEVLAAHGSYAGFMYFQPDEKVSALDSIAAEWDIVSDTILELRSVPTSLLVDRLSEKHQALKDAVIALGTVNMQVKIGFNVYYKSPLLFYVYPEPVTMNVNVDGENKTVVVNFYNTETNTQSFGQCLVSDGSCLLSLYPKDITEDGKGVKSFTTIDYAFIYWLGKKR